MAKRKLLTVNAPYGDAEKNAGAPFDKGYDEFISNAKVRGLSPYTIRFYNNVSLIVYKFLDERLKGYKTSINTFNPEIVDEFITYCRDLGENDITVNTNLRGLRVVLYYFMKVGYLVQFKISLPFNVSGTVISPNANTATIDDILLEACQCRLANISSAYRVRVVEVIGIDTAGLDFNTDSYSELYNVINELNERAKA